MSKRLTTKEFIEKAKKVHGDLYDYSLVEYVNNKTKVKIVCEEHGIFEQKPSNHLTGQGCIKCAVKSTIGNDYSKKSQDKVIAKFKKVHGDTYDYSKVVYTGATNNVTIVCAKHGEFRQSPSNHTGEKGGCILCKKENRFIERAIKKHGNRYDYSKIDDRDDKIEIVCSEHGSFFQTKKSHLRTGGCEKCGIEKRASGRRDTFESFVEKANKIHNGKYIYVKSDYAGTKSKMKIVCRDHGEFIQSANDHLTGSGCSACNKGGGFRRDLPAILYYLKVTEDENVAYKIGITNKTISQRYRPEDLTKITVLSELEFMIGADAYKEEQKILKEFADQKWNGADLLKNGNTELFKTDVLGLDI